jgi:HEPN domain-containing protein
MNRTDLQRLSNIRVREATALFKLGEYSGAYYLAGYAIECALKACFAKAVRRHDFPDKSRSRKVFIHNLPELLDLAELKKDLKVAMQADPILEAAWNVVCDWTEESRYAVWTRADAQKVLGAVKGRGGVLPWIKRRW